MKFKLTMSMILIGGIAIVVAIDRPVGAQTITSKRPDQFFDGIGDRGYLDNTYLALSLVGAASELVAGGTNTVFDTSSAFTNSPDSDTAGTLDFGGAVGKIVPTGFGSIRLEAEIFARSNMAIETGSFPGPANPPVGFFYHVEFTDRWSGMVNTWFDFPISQQGSIYIGGGVGVHSGNMYITDQVVGGREKFDNSAWQVGAGVNLHTNNRMTIDIGYRYVDLGTADSHLSRISDGRSSGNYTSAMTSHQVQLGIRFNRIRDFFR